MKELPKLPRAPLIFASLELRFSSMLSREFLTQTFDVANEKAWKSYRPYAAGYQKRSVWNTEKDKNDNQRIRFLLLTNAERNRSLTIGQDYCALTTQQYNQFADFFDEFRELTHLAFSEETRSHLSIKEIRLRYVDVFREIDDVPVVKLIDGNFFDLKKFQHFNVAQFAFEKSFGPNIVSGVLFGCKKNATKRIPLETRPTGLTNEDFEITREDVLFDYTARRLFESDSMKTFEEIDSYVKETHNAAERFFLECVSEIAISKWSCE